MQVLHLAFEQHLRFGRDIVFTYGPWGFLCGGYSPPTFAISVIVWAMLSLVFWLAGWRLARHFSNHQLVSWVWLMGFIAATRDIVEQDIDVRLAAWSALLCCCTSSWKTVRSHRSKPGCGVIRLIKPDKFTGLVEAAIVVAIIAVDNILRQSVSPGWHCCL